MKKTIGIGIGIVVVFLACLILIPSASATWCDNNYGKKAPILINNTGGTEQTDYQVELNYTYDSDMNADFSDARVYNESDCSLIPLWNESAVASSWNKIWFNATHIPASSWCNDTYYLYYDYSSASTASSGVDTFPFFDDFDYGIDIDWASEATSGAVMSYIEHGDINNDGEEEVIFIRGGIYYAFDSDTGSTIKKVTVGNTSDWECRNIKVGNITGDDYPEIAFLECKAGESTSKLIVMDKDGTELWNKSYSVNSKKDMNYLAIGKLNQSVSGLQIAVAKHDKVYAYDKDGNELWNHTVNFGTGNDQGGETFKISVIADFDNDGKNEIFVGGFYSPNIYMLNAENGTEVWSTTTSSDSDDAVFTDVNDDDISDVVHIGSGRGGTSSIAAFCGLNGTKLWETNFPNGLNEMEMYTNPDSGESEFIVGGMPTDKCTVFYENGTKKWESTIDESRWSHYVTVEDVNNDGKVEIMWASSGGDNSPPYYVRIVDLDGNLLQTLETSPNAKAITSCEGKVFVAVGFGANPVQRIEAFSYITGFGGSDFSDKWNLLGGTKTIEDSIIKCEEDGGGFFVMSAKQNAYGIGYGFEARAKETGNLKGSMVKPWTSQNGMNSETDDQMRLTFYDSATYLRDETRDNTVQTFHTDQVPNSHTTFAVYSILRHSTSKVVFQRNYGDDHIHTTNIPNDDLYFGVRIWDDLGAQMWLDWTRIRKCNDPEPTAQLGDEESPAVDTSFTITLPIGYIIGRFAPDNSTDTNVSADGQTDSVPFYNVTNTGNVNYDVKMQLNGTINTVTTKLDTDNNPDGAKELNTTLLTVYSELGQGNSVDIWLWSDFDHTPAQTTNRTVNISSVQ